MRLRLFAFLFLGALLAPSAAGQSVSIEAQATPSEAGVQEVVVYTIRVDGASLSDVQTPEPPSTTNLVLNQSTPSTKRDLSFQKGRLDRSIAFEWRYRPIRVGTARFRPTKITVRGKTYATAEIRVRIVPQSQRRSTPTPTPHGPPTTRRQPPPDAPSSADVLGPQDLFIRASAETAEAYQNEQVAIEYRLFFRPGIQLRHSRLANAWDANGFWREELDVASRPVPRSQEIDGTTYQTIVLKRVAVFPTRTGSLRVDPLRIETEAYASHRQSAGDYSLQSRYEPVTLSSEAITIDAAPLPPNPPSSFDGAVGSFSLTTRVSTDSVQAGEAVRLRAEIEGRGNLATLSAPSFDTPPDFESFDPETTTDIQRSGDVIRGSKTFTYLLVPRTGGTHTIPPVTFAYFDPGAGRYRTLRSSPARVHVTGQAAPTAVSTTGSGLPIGDIAGLMAASGEASVRWISADPRPLYRQGWPYAVALLPLLIAAGLVAYRRRSPDHRSADDRDDDASPAVDLDPGRHQEAMQIAQTHLQEAHRALRNGRTQPFYRAVERAVLGFIGRRLDRPVPSMMRSTLDALLQEHGVSDPTLTSLHELLDACDHAQFTPSHPSHDSMRAALGRAQELILQFDADLPEGQTSAC